MFAMPEYLSGRGVRHHWSCTSYSKYRPDGSIFVLFSNSCHSSADTSSGRVTSGVSVWNTLPAHFCMSAFLIDGSGCTHGFGFTANAHLFTAVIIAVNSLPYLPCPIQPRLG